MLRRTFLALGLVLAIGSVSFGQVKLERKMQEGATYSTEATNRLEQKLTIMGAESDTEADTKTTVKSTVGKRDGAGMLRVQEKIAAMQLSITTMGTNYFFDSANPDNKGNSSMEILRDLHKALLQATTTTVYDKENRIHTIESDQDVLNQVPEAVQKLAKSQLDPEQLKKAANQQLQQLPTAAVNKGDTWQRTETANFGAGQVMTFETKYTYEGTIEKEGKTLDKITGKTESIVYGLENSPLPLTVKGSELKAEESQATILFDRQRGQVVESTNKLRITGEIKFVANNIDLPAKLDLKMESSTVLKP